MTFSNKNILFPILTLIFVLLLILHLFNYQTSKNQNSNYIIKAYKNTVALYNGDEIVKIYNDIVLNTLPKTDIQNFKIGIPVSTKAQAETYLQDFES